MYMLTKQWGTPAWQSSHPVKTSPQEERRKQENLKFHRCHRLRWVKATNRELRFVSRSPEWIIGAQEGVVGAEVEVVTGLRALLLLGYRWENLKQNFCLLKITLKIKPIQAYDHQYKAWHQLWYFKPQEHCPLMSRTPLERSRSRRASWAFHISYRLLVEELLNN